MGLGRTKMNENGTTIFHSYPCSFLSVFPLSVAIFSGCAWSEIGPASIKTKKPSFDGFLGAERAGFEPAIGFPKRDFQSRALDQLCDLSNRQGRIIATRANQSSIDDSREMGILLRLAIWVSHRLQTSSPH